jgi:hypothetical protein
LQFAHRIRHIVPADDCIALKYTSRPPSADLHNHGFSDSAFWALSLREGFRRAVFTPNFDSVVEKAVVEVSCQSLSAHHLEGSHSANKALNNEEFPIYCKLYGDFRYDSLKNLPGDLAT